MIIPTGFQSWKDYFDFTLARKFVDTENQNDFQYPRNLAEKIGQVVSRPVIEPLSFATKNIRNPAFVLALSTSAIALTTIAFYPNQFMAVISRTVPFVLKTEPWMVKLGTYLSLEATIFGLGLRAFGRVSNQELLASWQERKIMAVRLGDVPASPNKV